MPQLAPLNWLFLFILFWILISMIMITFWWMKDKKYFIKSSSAYFFENNPLKWKW